jgi:hypothetical protein
MNKTAIQKYAILARNELIEQIKQRAYQYGISEKGYGDENATVISGRVLSSDEKHQHQDFVEQIKDHGYQLTIEHLSTPVGEYLDCSTGLIEMIRTNELDCDSMLFILIFPLQIIRYPKNKCAPYKTHRKVAYKYVVSKRISELCESNIFLFPD